ncbi:MAG TPA: DUF2442 domain-containing protein [Chitinophagaceae bacterium]|nr:DUF2442 domain-containing protein [Chitinophagaceae bacterium]HQV06545.1 DUF2442 domain-containing protein [Chitinophagaceae bacterium]
MRTIHTIQSLEDNKLLCTFLDGTVKIADITSYLKGEAFKPLLDKENFSKFENHKYYILWPDFELDLNADTLWHIGINTNNKNAKV